MADDSGTSCLYLLERQPHVAQLHLLIHRPPSAVAFHLEERKIVLRIKGHGIVPIPLPCPITIPDTSHTTPTASSPASSALPASAVTVHKAASSCLLRLPVAPSAAAASFLSDTFPRAAELQPGNYPCLRCRSCSVSSSPLPLLQYPPSRCLPLPSAYWSELVDLWYCHTEGNAELDRLCREGVAAVKEGTMLLGVEELRLAVDDVRLQAVSIDDEWREEKLDTGRTAAGRHSGNSHHRAHGGDHHEEKEESKDNGDSADDAAGQQSAVCLFRRGVRCADCHTSLGSAVCFSSPPSSHSFSPPPPTELHLMKHRLTNVADDGDGRVPSLFLPHYTLETYLSSQLLALCQARCSHRFRLQPSASSSASILHSADAASTSCSILLTLLNLDTSIRTGSLPPSSQSADDRSEEQEVQQDEVAMTPVLKVSYEVVRQEVGEQSASGKSSRGAVSAAAATVLEYSAEDLLELERLLQQRSSLVPAEFRQLGRRRLSFLFRLSE